MLQTVDRLATDEEVEVLPAEGRAQVDPLFEEEFRLGEDHVNRSCSGASTTSCCCLQTLNVDVSPVES